MQTENTQTVPAANVGPRLVKNILAGPGFLACIAVHPGETKSEGGIILPEATRPHLVIFARVVHVGPRVSIPGPDGREPRTWWKPWTWFSGGRTVEAGDVIVFERSQANALPGNVGTVLLLPASEVQGYLVQYEVDAGHVLGPTEANAAPGITDTLRTAGARPVAGAADDPAKKIVLPGGRA